MQKTDDQNYANQALADYRTQLKEMPQERQDAFASTKKLPLRDRLELVEFQLMHLTLLLQASAEAQQAEYVKHMQSEGSRQSKLVMPN